MNAASGVEGLVPGGIASLFGSGLTRVNGIVSASSTPLAVELAGTSVSVNGTKVPLLAVANVNGTEQINFQAPFELLAPGTAKLVVTNNGIDSAAADTAVFAAQPGVFTMDGVAGRHCARRGQSTGDGNQSRRTQRNRGALRNVLRSGGAHARDRRGGRRHATTP